MRYLLGIDGGGTQTRAILTDEMGNVCGQSIGGPANFHSVGLATAIHNIKECIVQVLAIYKKSQPPVDMHTLNPVHLGLGLAGVGRPDDHKVMLEGLQKVLGDLVTQLTLTTDAHIALRGALKGAEGVVVIAGTGAIALGTKAGRVERAGGWGYLLDDRGSGYDLGRTAITAALRAFDGRGEETRLVELICQHFQLKQLPDIIAPIYQGQLDRPTIAGLVPLILEAAGQGDNVSREILRASGQELATAAMAVAGKLELVGMYKIAGTGGVLSRKLPYLYPAYQEAILREYPEAEIIDAIFEPVYGALIMAAENAGLTIDHLIRRWENGNEAKSNSPE